MAADIITTLQTFTDPNTTQALTLNQAQGSETQTEPGLFDSLVAECMDTEILPEMLVPETQTEPEAQTLTFTGNNTFAQPVIDLLAGTQEHSEEVLPEPEIIPDEDAVTWPEDAEQPNSENFVELKQAFRDIKDFARSRLAEVEIPAQEIAEKVLTDEVLAEIPDELRTEIGHVINEVADAITQEDGSAPQPVMSMLNAISQRIAVPEPEPEDVAFPEEQEEQEEPSDADETLAEVPEDGAEFAGLAFAPNVPAQTVQSDSPETQDQPDVTDAPARQARRPVQNRPEQRELEIAPEDPQEGSQNVRTNFREVLENPNADNEAPEQENPGSGQDQSQTQGQSQNSGQNFADKSDSSTRSRRIEPRTQAERSTDQQTTTRRTESRSDFASFFEGVLSNRRTASRAPAQPLDLRGTENFTQATALRDGITNVVRFIRADGVQKARVVVDPPALGRVSVELTSGTSGVEASIKVSSEQIRQLVQDQLSQLRMNLSQQGVQVAEFTVDVQQDNSGQQHNPQQQEQAMLNFGDIADDETEEFRVDLDEGLLYWVA